MTDPDFDDIDEASLRRRRSAKWAAYPADVLPAWVAEMDFAIAAPIRQALVRAIECSDTGYAFAADLGEATAQWLGQRWGVDVRARDVFAMADVVTAIREVLRATTAPGDAVVIEPPVYPPFAATVLALGRRVVDVPLLHTEGGWSPDLAGIERAYAAGARVHLLCSPQNPTGLVISRAAQTTLADLADRYDVLVVADEIHAPLTLPGAVHTPMLAVSHAARRRSVLLTSASKAWNVAGLKCAVMVAVEGPARAAAERVPREMAFHVGHFGVLATLAAFDAGDAWLKGAVAVLDRNRAHLGALLAAALPGIRYIPPQAGYLAWLDCRALGLGKDPANVFLARGRVALSSGPTFGTEGAGHARLNIATSRSLLEEAVRRMRRAVDEHGGESR